MKISSMATLHEDLKHGNITWRFKAKQHFM